MDKEVSIVLSREVKNHRKLAQQWYGLTNEQMIDMDVHHNPARHEGGRNIPEHLFVYHKTLHSAVHGGDFTKWAREGGKLGAKAQPREVRVRNGTIHGPKNLQEIIRKNPNHQREAGLQGAEARRVLFETSEEFREKYNMKKTHETIRERRKDPEYDKEYRKGRKKNLEKGRETIRERRKDPEYEEEFRKQCLERIRKAHEKNKKPVVCTNIDTGEERVFASISEASIALGRYAVNISNVARGKNKRAGRWRVRFQGKT